MKISKQMKKENYTDLENLFVEDFKRLLAVLYKKHISEVIKRGIKAKKLKNNYETNWNPSSTYKTK